jgi:hypothetical protein
MQVWNSLPDEISDLGGSSPGSIALCRAIIEDAEMAREFEIEPRGAVEMLCTVMWGTPRLPSTSAPLPRELTNLIF